MERKTITIPAPIARDVEALNHLKRPAVWESGQVLNEPIWYVSDTFPAGGWWSYRVRLDRVSATDRPIDLHVGDQGIRIP